MKKNQDRIFVRHRNDTGIPFDREIEVTETESKHLTSYPEVSVIIPTSDGYRNGYFPALLKQLSEQTFQDFEAIVIKGDPRQGRAINTGVDLARGKYILTLDDDTSIRSKDAFEKLVEVMENEKTIGMAGGINLIPPDATPFVRRVMREIPRRSSPKVDKITDSDLAEHPLLIMRKEVFEKVGGENELVPRGLDPYLREQFRRTGYRIVVVPGVLYSHLPPSTLLKLIKQFYRNGKGAAYCNKFYPQWVIETPDDHIGDFKHRVLLPFRMVRYALRMLKAFIQFQWVYLLTHVCYAAGFAWGYLTLKEGD